MKTVMCGFCMILLLTIQLKAQDTMVVRKDVLAKASTSWDGRRLPDYPKGRPEITILKIVIPPHERLPLHMHPVINAGVVIKGNLTVVTEENETLHLKAGDSIVEVVDKGHYGKNDGNEPAEIIIFYAGVEGTPITVYEEKVM